MVVSYYDERNEYIHTITDKDTLASMISIMEYTVNSDIDELSGYEHCCFIYEEASACFH